MFPLKRLITPALSDKLQQVGLLVLRAGLGLSMLLGHGMAKLERVGDPDFSFPDPIGLGSGVSMVLVLFAEVACSLGLVLGLFTRLAAVPLLITMAVAFFVVHGDDPWGRREMAALYMFGYLAVILAGPGKLSLDEKISKPKEA